MNNAKSKPSHRLYQVIGEGDDAQWLELAAAWPHKDNKGYTILAPFLGKIIMREITAQETQPIPADT
jgi:hypothetical protein